MTTISQTKRVFNFSAGPAALPQSVLEQIRDELVCMPGVGASVMEISHRSADFDRVLDDAKSRVSRLLNLPEDYEVLFLQGGAALQNVMVPANLLTTPDQTADYIVTGNWGKKSAAEVKHYGKLNIAFDGANEGFTRLPTQEELSLTNDAAYCHLTSNETIQGVQFKKLPDTGSTPLVIDKSSDMFCGPIDVNHYGLIYACAQKNVGIAGVTMVILRKPLIERSGDRLPSYLSYAKHSKGGSRFNTPPTFAIYVTGLVCKWLEDEMGGLEAMQDLNRRKAKMLYDVIDANAGFYQAHAASDCRSIMNVVFRMESDELNQKFLDEAANQSMTTLKGHRSIGGIRASIYNAMPLAGVEALAQFMQDFVSRNG